MIENIACMPVPKLGKKCFRNLNKKLSFKRKRFTNLTNYLIETCNQHLQKKNANNKVPQGKCCQELKFPTAIFLTNLL